MDLACDLLVGIESVISQSVLYTCAEVSDGCFMDLKRRHRDNLMGIRPVCVPINQFNRCLQMISHITYFADMRYFLFSEDRDTI